MSAVLVTLILACAHPALAQLAPPRRPGETPTGLSNVIDPWGTAIEMTEYLAPDTH